MRRYRTSKTDVPVGRALTSPYLTGYWMANCGRHHLLTKDQKIHRYDALWFSPTHSKWKATVTFSSKSSLLLVGTFIHQVWCCINFNSVTAIGRLRSVYIIYVVNEGLLTWSANWSSLFRIWRRWSSMSSSVLCRIWHRSSSRCFTAWKEAIVLGRF